MFDLLLICATRPNQIAIVEIKSNLYWLIPTLLIIVFFFLLSIFQWLPDDKSSESSRRITVAGQSLGVREPIGP